MIFNFVIPDSNSLAFVTTSYHEVPVDFASVIFSSNTNRSTLRLTDCVVNRSLDLYKAKSPDFSSGLLGGD